MSRSLEERDQKALADVVRILREAGVNVRKVNHEKPSENGVECKLEVEVPTKTERSQRQLDAVKDAALETAEFGLGGQPTEDDQHD